VLPYSSAYYFVCPEPYLAMPKVVQFRDWLVAAAREFPRPAAALTGERIKRRVSRTPG
jgi:hypothetical protein